MKISSNLVSLVIASFIFVAGRSSFAVEAPKIVHKDGRSALFVAGEPYLMLGAQMDNSSECPSTLPDVWEAVAKIHPNTLGARVYWEQMEPYPGPFALMNFYQFVR